MIRIGSLCSGYGGLETAVTAALAGPIQVAFHAEVDPAASRVLKSATPDVPNLGDLRLIDWSAPELPVHLLCMGVPCQPASSAGRRAAEDDPRWLWPDARRAIRELRPPAFVFENVEGLVTLRGGEVWRGILADMRAEGYAVRWLVMGACVVGACHHRHRVFALGAYVGPAAPPAVRLDVSKCGARRGAVHLPTPLARDGRDNDEGSAAYWERKGRGPERMPLSAIISAGLLPTPQSRDGRGAGISASTGQARLDSGRRNLDDAVATLLPTPKAGDGTNGHNYRNNRGEPGGMASVSLLLPTPTSTIGERFGRYAAAVERWAQVCGIDPPKPTETGPRGGVRLAPAFPAWMMGVPFELFDGESRTDTLRMIGNGVMPTQGARALGLLLGSA